MELNKYQELAARTINKKLSYHGMTNHALFGMCGEVGELQSLYQKVYQGHRLDYHELALELGDLLWFVAEFCTANGWTLEQIAQMNIGKLKARYPEGFAEEKSINRAEGDI